jgi:hypothetical protein
MRTILFILTLTLSIGTLASCKSKKAATSTSTATSSNTSEGSGSVAMGTSTTTASTTTTTAGSMEQGNNQGAFVGRVSHKYREGGCATVIIIPGEGSEITLIPKDKLRADIDMDGQLIKFDYRALKMPQPAGCTVGIPAEITNINKMK